MENAESSVDVFIRDASCNAAGVDVLAVDQASVKGLSIGLQG